MPVHSIFRTGISQADNDFHVEAYSSSSAFLRPITSGSAPSAQTISAGDFAAKPTPDPSRSGYIFGGWYDNSACTGNQVNFFSYKIISNKTFYAKWSPSTTPTISGFTLVCYGSPKSFSASNWLSEYKWAVSGSKLSLSSPTTNSSVTVSVANSSSNGIETVNIMYGTTIVASFQVWVGTPVLSIAGSYSVQAGNSSGYQYTVSATSDKSATSSYSWNVTTPGAVVYGYGTQANVYFNDVGYYQVSCKGINVCGTGQMSAINVQAD